MKKIFSILAGFLLIFSLTACSSHNTENSDSNSDVSDILEADSVNTEANKLSSDFLTDTSDKKTLIVYFSATGNTREAAEYIASATGGDLFELVPVKPYSKADLNWNDENSRVVYEHEHPESRDITLVNATVGNFAEYDTVFIGYPIWWGLAAWPVDGFIEANDFTGKTVIPFCTSASSGLGDSGTLLKEAAGTGNWLKGKRFSSEASKTEMEDWIQNLIP